MILRHWQSEMRFLFAGIKVVGCTTAGEIGHDGFRKPGITGVSFPSDSFSAVADRIECLQSFEVRERSQICTGTCAG